MGVKMLGIKNTDHHVMLEMLDNLNINVFPRKMNKKKRIVRKGGLTNVTYKNISKKRRRYISDLYTTLLDSSWSYVVLLFASSFYGSWILFGVIYYMICLTHGDFSPEHLDQSDHDQLSSRNPRHVSPGGPGLHHPGIHGGSR